MIHQLGDNQYRVEPLSSFHDRAKFFCDVPALDSYLQRQARQNVDRKLASVFVLTTDGQSIAGFYSLSASSVLAADLPEAYAKKLPRFPIPVTLLGRMAVSKQLQGLGIGGFLLGHAMLSALDASSRVASWALVVDAKEGAYSFYEKNGFLPLQPSSSRLFLPLATAKKAVGLS